METLALLITSSSFSSSNILVSSWSQGDMLEKFNTWTLATTSRRMVGKVVGDVFGLACFLVNLDCRCSMEIEMAVWQILKQELDANIGLDMKMGSD